MVLGTMMLWTAYILNANIGQCLNQPNCRLLVSSGNGSLGSSHVGLDLGDSARNTGKQFHTCLCDQHVVLDSHLQVTLHLYYYYYYTPYR